MKNETKVPIEAIILEQEKRGRQEQENSSRIPLYIDDAPFHKAQKKKEVDISIGIRKDIETFDM